MTLSISQAALCPWGMSVTQGHADESAEKMVEQTEKLRSWCDSTSRWVKCHFDNNKRRLWHDEGGYASTITYRQLKKDPTPTKERQKLGEGEKITSGLYHRLRPVVPTTKLGYVASQTSTKLWPPSDALFPVWSGASQLPFAWIVKASSVPARNELKNLPTFWPECTGLNQASCDIHPHKWNLNTVAIPTVNC